MRLYTVLGLLLIQAVLAFFSWTNPLLQDSNVLSAILIFFVPMPTLLIALIYLYDSKNRFFLFTGLSGVATFMPAAFLLTQMERYKAVGLLLYFLIASMVFCMYGFTWLLFRFLYKRFQWSVAAFLPTTFAAVAFMRVHFAPHLWLIPPPSRMFAYPLVGLPPLIQMASYTSVVGPEFLVIFVATVMGMLLWETGIRRNDVRQWLELPEQVVPLEGGQKKKSILTASAVGAFMLLLILLGNFEAMTVAKAQDNAKRVVRPALLQSQLNPASWPRWDRSVEVSTIITYRKMMQEAKAKKADFVVFTENGLPMALPRSIRLWRDLKLVVQELHMPAIVGAITNFGEERSVNMWYHLGADGKVQGYYIKRSLVPFGEFLPMRWIVDPVLDAINFTFKKTYKVFKLTSINKDNYDLRKGEKGHVFDMGPGKIWLSVCDESKYPVFFREGARLGGESVYSLGASNWFFTPVYFNKQLQTAAYRAVECRRWVSHLSSMGGSAQVDALGIVRVRSPYGKRSVLVSPIPCLTMKSFYVRFGNVFGWLCFLTTLALMALGLYHYYRDKGRGEQA